MAGFDHDRVAFETARLELARLRVTMGDGEVALQSALRLCARTLKVERVGFWQFASDGGSLALRGGHTLSTGEWSAGELLTRSRYPGYWQAVQARRVIAAHDARTDAATRDLTDSYLVPLGITSILDAPVFRAGELVGVVCFEHVGPARTWTADELTFASAAGDLIAMLLEQRDRMAAEAALRIAAGRSAAAEKLALVEQLSRGVAHDFANVLMAIELVARRLGERDAEAAAMLRSCAEVGGNLVGQLRRFGDRQAPAPHTLPLVAVLERLRPIVVTLVRDVAEVTLDVAALPADVAVTMAPAHVEQVVLNLCLNARDAVTARGTIVVSATAVDDRVILTVRDDGVGMTPAVLARIWEPYFTTKAHGTGLGLATVRSLVDEADATIDVTSAPGAGTTFTVTLRRA